MGMNSVRFYLSYRTFEDDTQPYKYKESGWDWLDQNVEWAKAEGVRLVLNMHAPVGGYQSQGGGNELWNDPAIQERFIALWRAIAERYRAEPTVAGFDILNEPLPTESIAQWKDLAERTISEIREVNQHHIVYVERANAVGGDWSENAEKNFFRVSDPNVVYEFHFYKPYHFTHQNAAWSDFAAREGWYPDEEVPEIDWYHLKTEAVVHSESLPPGDSEWTMLETKPFDVYEGATILGKPFLVCDSGQGKATFDSLSLTRLGGGELTKSETKVPPSDPRVAPDKSSLPASKGQREPEEERELETIFAQDLDTRRGWYFWTKNGEGEALFVPEGHGDSTALTMIGTTGPANLGADGLRFRVEPGNRYQLQGLAKGQGLGEKAKCRLRLEFYSSSIPILSRTKEYLKQELDAYLAWGRKEEVPLYLGEFGAIRDSFLPGRGGVTWVSDMLDLLEEAEVNFAYHTYHERPFGLYNGEGQLPGTPQLNQPLYDLFVQKLGGTGEAKATEPEPVRSEPEPVEETEPAKESSITEFD